MWLVVPFGLVALYALHELVVLVVARRLGGEPRRVRAFVVVRRRRAALLAFVAALLATYVAICGLVFAFFVSHGVATGEQQLFVGVVKDGFDASGKLVT